MFRDTTLDMAFQALADPSRRAMVDRLVQGPATVSELAKPLAMSLPGVMQHLAVLEASGLVISEKIGRTRTCRIEPLGALEANHAQLAARMVDIATGLYSGVVQADFVDPIEYQHSMGAALAAQSVLASGETALRAENARAYADAEGELNRFVALWASPTAPEQPPAYRDVLAQGSRVRLALSPYL